MHFKHRRRFGAQRSRRGQAVLALFIGFAFALGMTFDSPRAAADEQKECAPAEQPMGSAVDALRDRNKSGGMRSQQGAIEELQKCVGIAENETQKLLKQLQQMMEGLQMASPDM